MMRRLVALTALALLAFPAAASAHGAPGVLRDAVKLGEQLYEVPLRTGGPLITHGVDAPPQAGSDATSTNGRPPLCASGQRQQVLYGRPVTAKDTLATARPVMEAAIFNMNAELDRAAMESGGRHADYKVKCDASGSLDIASFVNLGSSSFRDVIDAARLSGHLDTNTDYVIFYDDRSTSACGVGSFTTDDRPGPDNAANQGGGYAVLYSGCWDGATAMHEVGHTMGAVQPTAPNGTGSFGHCRDESDVMCYADGAEGPIGMLSVCAGGERFDCGYDDYFDVAPERGEYLASHWNLGSAANRFIVLSDPVPGEAAATPRCVESDGALLAVDTIGCAGELPPQEDPAVEEVEEPAVRILKVSYLQRPARVRARLACPASRLEPCHGRVLLARRTSRASGGKTFRIRPGRRIDVRIRLVPAARRAWLRGDLRRVWVVAQPADASAQASRLVRLRSSRR